MRLYLAKISPRLEAAIERLFPRKFGADIFNQYFPDSATAITPELWRAAITAPFYTLFDRGGKRLRPVLACLTHDALGGRYEEIYSLAIIPEMIHTGTLIIDDIEDNSKLRRGGSTAHELHGVGLALNAGNLLYFLPQLIVAQSALPPEKKLAIYELINETMAKLHFGQSMDIFWSTQKRRDVTMAQYLEMCGYKTGGLLRIAIELGALVADAPTKVARELGAVATDIGIAFQITDDLLNLKPGALGKEHGEDITEGKLTYPVIDSLARAEADDRARLAGLLSRHTAEPADIAEAIGIMEHYGSLARARDAARQRILAAKEKINRLLPESENKKIYLEILDFVVQRGK